ncbi:hypothetical protein WDU94_015521 [Cyamophila willieti]
MPWRNGMQIVRRVCDALLGHMLKYAVEKRDANQMTTESFMAAFKRFIARRSPVLYMYSDNGSNFVGAKRKLDEDFRLGLIQQQIVWKFSPPSAPHMSGIWESGVNMLLKSSFKTFVPEVTSQADNDKFSSRKFLENDTKNKQKAKVYADETRHAKYHDLAVGDRVLIKFKPNDKYFSPEMFEITKIAGNQISVNNERAQYVRNSSCVKKFNGHPVFPEEDKKHEKLKKDEKSNQLSRTPYPQQFFTTKIYRRTLAPNVNIHPPQVPSPLSSSDISPQASTSDTVNLPDVSPSISTFSSSTPSLYSTPTRWEPPSPLILNRPVRQRRPPKRYGYDSE